MAVVVVVVTIKQVHLQMEPLTQVLVLVELKPQVALADQV
jgi:hypothetical protein